VRDTKFHTQENNQKKKETMMQPTEEEIVNAQLTQLKAAVCNNANQIKQALEQNKPLADALKKDTEWHDAIWYGLDKFGTSSVISAP
jgi:hypothetical protein